MPSYILYYFNLRGRAEATRLMFKVAGVEFEDRRLNGEEWLQLKMSGKAPFGQMPLLEVDGKIIAQSIAIGRFVANEVGLAPSTNLLKAQADMIVDGCSDFGSKLITPRFEKDESKKALLLEELKTLIPTQLKIFETILKDNNGGESFFVGDKLSYADIVFFNLINYAFGQGKLETPNDLKEYPLLQKHFELVMNIPNIKKWLQERPLTDL